LTNFQRVIKICRSSWSICLWKSTDRLYSLYLVFRLSNKFLENNDDFKSTKSEDFLLRCRALSSFSTLNIFPVL